MAKKNQSKRLTEQHKHSHGVIGIFGEEAQIHDKEVSDNQYGVKSLLEQEYPMLIISNFLWVKWICFLYSNVKSLLELLTYKKEVVYFS